MLAITAFAASSCAHAVAFQRRGIQLSQGDQLGHLVNIVYRWRIQHDGYYLLSPLAGYATAYQPAMDVRSPRYLAALCPSAERQSPARTGCHRALHLRVVTGW